MSKSVIFYTDNLLDEQIAAPVRKSIMASGLPILSVSLQPIDFGNNIVYIGERGYITMMYQIITALENSKSDYVFFCEHDVLYNKSHFEFTPPRDDIFYYNENVWRWMIGTNKMIRHDRMLPLSAMCCNRKLALHFYLYRLEKMKEIGFEYFRNNQAELIRKWGFEPGTKKIRRGGLTDDDFATWKSREPIIDIRHPGTFSPPKYTLESFKHKPENWQEVTIRKAPL